MSVNSSNIIISNTTNIFRGRANPGGNNKYQLFINDKFYSIGWAKAGSFSGLDRSAITRAIQSVPEYSSTMSPHGISLAAGYALRLLKMKSGDIILITDPDSDNITVSVVTTPYQYTPEELMTDTAHRVGIDVITTIKLRDLTTLLQKTIQTQPTLVSLDKYSDEINAIFGGIPLPDSPVLTNVHRFSAEFGGNSITLEVTENVTKDDLKIFFDNVNL